MHSPFYALTSVAFFAALIAALGLVPKIDLPFGVPITLQSLGVMLCGCLLGARRGLQAVALLMLGVAIGLPLLSGGRGGLGAFVAPTSGYFMGWLAGAWVTGHLMQWLSRRLRDEQAPQAAVAAFVASLFGGVVVVHACGVVGLVVIAKMQWAQAAWGTLIFVPSDLVKCAICALVVHTVWRHVPAWRLHTLPPTHHT